MREREMNWNDDILEKHNHIYTQTSLNQKIFWNSNVYFSLNYFLFTFQILFKHNSPKIKIKKKIKKQN